MRKFKEILLVTIFGASLTIFMYCNRGEDHSKKQVIKSTTDARGLTSVIYKDGKDTFALDYLAPSELDSLICPDCGETDCIYREIDVTYDTTHLDLLDAILNVCNRRGITDSTTIDLIKANYDL